jgi:hypothetical protein
MAVDASLRLGRRLGLNFDQPELIADGFSVRVRIGPALTRVVTRGCRLRGEARPWLQREIAIADWLSKRGAAVIAPWGNPGPHEIDGLSISLWTFVMLADEAPPSSEIFGQALAALHADLEDCPFELPVLAGPLADINAALRYCDHPLLHQAARRLLPLVPDWPSRPLHGDAHPGNLVRTASGWCWIDFEDVCMGPPEWDLASTLLDDAAVRAYGGPVCVKRLASCRNLRRLQVFATLLLDGASEEELSDGLLAALEHCVRDEAAQR